SFAAIADVSKLQREVVGEGVLHTHVPTPYVGGFEIGVHAHKVAGNCFRATESAALRKHNAIPVERGGGVTGVGELVGAPKGLRTRLSNNYRCGAGARRVRGYAGAGAVLEPELCRKRACGERRVDDTAPSPNYCRPLTGDIPGDTQAR